MKNHYVELLAQGLRVSVLSMLLLVAACGGGGYGSNPNSPSGPSFGGINGGGFAVGTITGFGSIFVNGVEFTTSSASIRIDGAAGSESQLKLGQVVTVQGTISDDGKTGVATTVTFDDNVEGPIQSVNVSAGTFVVLGQTVRVTATTLFEGGISPADITGLVVGNTVEVSGFVDSTGVVVASRIERKGGGGGVEVTGPVSSLDTNARRFAINALQVDYSLATVSNGTLANGVCVEVKGSSFTGGTLMATRVEIKSCTLAAAENERGQIEGLITRFASSTDFDVSGVRVTTTANTTFANGAAGDLRADVKVEVGGVFNASNILVASKVEIKPDSDSRLLGTVDSLDATTNTLVIFGINVNVTTGTELKDSSSARLSPLRFSDLRTGDYLEVRGYAASTPNTIAAVLAERDDLDARRELRGRVTAVAQPNLTILGVSVSTSASTQFRNTDDSAMTADAFFAAAANRVVKVRGTWNGAVFVASEVELES